MTIFFLDPNVDPLFRPARWKNKKVSNFTFKETLAS
jgi:hypothetical protein